MSDHLGQSEVRKMAERWWIQVCPECNGLVGERSQAHNETCPNRDGRIFVPRSVEVTPVLEHVDRVAISPHVAGNDPRLLGRYRSVDIRTSESRSARAGRPTSTSRSRTLTTSARSAQSAQARF